MMVHLDKENIKSERRKLLGDDIYVIFHDVLKQLQKEDETKFSPVELFLSAKTFVKTIMDLPDVMEGLEDEMDDLEDEAEGENDAMLVMMLASGMFRALGTRRIGFDAKSVILKIYGRWNDHKLFFRVLDGGCRKEEARWMEGKKTQLLTYELNSIDEDNEGIEAARQIFDEFIKISDQFDKESIKGCLIVLNKYNNDHGNVYNKEIDALYEKLGVKNISIGHVAGDLVMEKNIANNVENVAPNAIGIDANKKK